MQTVTLPRTASVAMTPGQVLSALLDQIGDVVLGLPDGIYTTGADGVSGTIGAHVRHCLDHVAALLSAGPVRTLSYDHRERGTAIEADPRAALQQILHLQDGLRRWPAASLDDPVRVASLVSTSGGTIAGWSTLGRELAFVISHTVHHQAIIALLLTMHGCTVPDRFGYAASTPRLG